MDSPGGERFNVEINHTGLNTHADEYYLTWPVNIRGTRWQTETKFLRSLSPREDLAFVWSGAATICERTTACRRPSIASLRRVPMCPTTDCSTNALLVCSSSGVRC